VGSNNWSSDGTQYNRDTSLVFYSEEIAAYYNEVFMFDWDNLTREISKKISVTPIIAPEGAPTPEGMIRVSWQEWYED
jgi:phosphatidylserine/phosphatidylglycerophosphate/cardiolipin synthase-like enzyme